MAVPATTGGLSRTAAITQSRSGGGQVAHGFLGPFQYLHKVPGAVEQHAQNPVLHIHHIQAAGRVEELPQRLLVKWRGSPATVEHLVHTGIEQLDNLVDGEVAQLVAGQRLALVALGESVALVVIATA